MWYRTRSEAQTIALAKRFARHLKGGDVVLLEGELGSGKTTFVRGLAQAFGIKERITSPTFVLMHIHELKNQGTKEQKNKNVLKSIRPSVLKYFVHCDAYRVKSARELKDISLADWLSRPDTITVVEWGEKIRSLLKGRRYKVIKFQHGNTPEERKISIVHPPIVSAQER